MPRKRKPAAKKAAPRPAAKKSHPKPPAGAKAEHGKGGAKKKSNPYLKGGWHTPWLDPDKKKGKGGKKGGKGGKTPPKVKPPAPTPDVPSAEPLEPPKDALVEWRKSHPVTPPTFTGYSTGDLGGGPQQTAPGAPPKQNGAPIYTPAPPAATPYTPTAPEQVSWGQILSDYYASTAGAPAGWYSDGGPTPSGVQQSPYPVRPDINLETAQQMMSKVSGGFYTGGQA